MENTDKAAFRNMLDTVMALYGKPSPDTDVVKVWWGKLNKYEFNTITRAFNNYVDKYKIMPSPASILDQCKTSPIPNYVHQLSKSSDPEVLKSNREKFRQVISEFKNRKKPEPKDWAKKIINNPTKYPEIALRFAKEACHVRDEV